jgi:hypothetical protein
MAIAFVSSAAITIAVSMIIDHHDGKTVESFDIDDHTYISQLDIKYKNSGPVIDITTHKAVNCEIIMDGMDSIIETEDGESYSAVCKQLTDFHYEIYFIKRTSTSSI